MNALAERYVKIVLALGQHDADYVDAYYGPPEWKARGGGQTKVDLDAIATRRRAGCAPSSRSSRRAATR